MPPEDRAPAGRQVRCRVTDLGVEQLGEQRGLGPSRREQPPEHDERQEYNGVPGCRAA